MVKAVLPAPLGPTSRNVGSPVALAAFLYRNVWRRIGIRSANATVTRMAMGDGARAHVSQLSSSYHAMVEGDARSNSRAVSFGSCSGLGWVWMRGPDTQGWE
jgi:hypothetical protein